jgi:hypothetical protein
VSLPFPSTQLTVKPARDDFLSENRPDSRQAFQRSGIGGISSTLIFFDSVRVWTWVVVLVV